MLVQRIGDLDGMAQDLIERQRAFPQPLRERLALEIFHELIGAILTADVVKGADARMT